jgi:hypothetical protein
VEAALNGIQGLQAELTDEESGRLSPLGINCLRTFTPGDISQGIVKVVLGFAPLRPAEFVIVKLTLKADQSPP